MYSQLNTHFKERVTGLQRAIAQLDAKKRESERHAQRLEKDKSLLKKSFSTVSLANFNLFGSNRHFNES